MGAELATAFLVGLLGGVHCVGMCGGIVSTLTLGLARDGRPGAGAQFGLQLAYNLGRILSYALAGALMGGLGSLALKLGSLQLAQKLLLSLSGLFMLALGLYLGGWWLGLAQVERLGGAIWRRLEPWGRRLLPVRTLGQALGLGLIWGWLPCGLVYSTLVWAVSTGGPGSGAALLLAFGLGTLPNLLAVGFLAGGMAHWSRHPLVRQGSGLILLGFGFQALWRAWLA